MSAAPDEHPWSPHHAFAPFLAAIDGGERLLLHVNRLAQARDAFAFRTAVGALLAELGYEPFVVDETTRLNSQTVLRRLTTVARHGRFVVSVIELAYPQRHASALDPVFRLHPQGLVFTYSPLFESSSVIFQPAAAKEGPRLAQRMIVGRGRGLDVRDNLAVWAWRLAGLRPRFGENHRSLVRRVSEHLALPVEEVDRRWSSAASTTTSPPGLSWGASLEWCQRGFTEAAAGGWCWGLERVLRNQFPLLDAQRRWAIRYRSFEVGDVEVTADALHAEGCRHRRIRLGLVIDDQITAETIEECIEVAIPVADRYGVFLVDGIRARFAPQVGRTGRILSGGRSDVDGDHADGRSGLVANAPVQIGIDLGAFLEIAVGRKLGGMTAGMTRTLLDVPPLGRLRRMFSRARGGRPVPLLVSRNVLRSTLRICVADDARSLPALVDGRDGPIEPPAWCCPEITRALPVGYWYPVAGARLTPCGGLAVPFERSDRQIAWCVPDGAAFAVNPRWGGPAAGPLAWWIAEPLAEFAGCAPGSLPRPVLLATHRPQLRGLIVARRIGTRLRAAIARRSVAPLAFPTQRLSRAVSIEEGPPRLLVEPGSRIEPGMAWLASKGPPRRPAFAEMMVMLADNARSDLGRGMNDRRRRATLRSDTHTGDPDRTQSDCADEAYWSAAAALEAAALDRVSPGIEGVVMSARVEPIHEGEIQVCWRATVIVRRPDDAVLPAMLWLADGTLVDDIEWLDPQDTPTHEAGPVDVVLEIPGDTEAPGDGLAERVEDVRRKQVLARQRRANNGGDLGVHVEDVRVLPGTPARVDGPDWHGRRRARDGEYIPTTGDAPGLRAEDRLWWALRDPDGHAEVAARECAWSQEVPPWWPNLQEVLAAVALIPCEPSSAGPPRESQRTLSLMREVLRENGAYEAPIRGAWRCTCGAQESPTPKFVICTSCGTPLRPEPITGVPRLAGWFSTKLKILHPWAKGAAAGLLGLTTPEFDRLFAEHTVAAMHASIQAALADPLAHTNARIARDGGLHPDLADSLADLQALRAGGGEALPIFVDLSRLPRLSDALCPLWRVAGSPVPVRNPLSAAYGALEQAIVRLKELESHRLTPPWLVEVARHEVQRAADRLFGSASEPPQHGEPRTLADLVGRLLPWTRPPGLRSSPPGLVRITGQVDADATTSDRRVRSVQRILLRPPVFVDFEDPDATATVNANTIADFCHSSTMLVESLELAPHGDAPTRSAVLLEQGLRWLPLRPAFSGAWAEPRTWQRRRALAWFMANAVSLLGALGLRSGIAGLSATSTLFAHLGPESDLCNLRAMLTSALGYHLTDDPTSARASVGEATSEAFPGEGATLTAARAWLVEQLIGWWRLPASVDDPLGWRWVAGDERPEGRCQRVIPGVRSRAWETLDDWLLLHRPCLWWLRDPSRVDLSSWPAALKILVGAERWPSSHRLTEHDDRLAEAHALPVRVSMISLPMPASAVMIPMVPDPESPSPSMLLPPAIGLPRLELLRGSFADWLLQQCRS